ncbi:MAG: SBBP repeat-containing protein, partial [Pyrinomonadaceae bacterium]
MPHPRYRLSKARPNGARVLLVAACLLTAALTLSQTLLPSGSAEARRAAGPDGAAVRLSAGYGELPLRFEANVGQTGRAAKFLARGSGYTLFLSETGAVLRLRGAEAAGGEVKSARDARDATLRFKLEGANRSPKISGVGELAGKSNYLVGSDARRWRTGVSAFEKVKYESVYPGIDAVYYGRQGRLEYDFVVAPGANPARIRLAFDGARATRIDEGGDLVITTDVGDVRQQRPVAYQERDGARTEVASRYLIDARGRVRFELGDYDRTRALVIDPVLVYSSYLGGIDADQGVAVAVDSAGSAYVVGTTVSADFPVAGGFQPVKSGSNDAFVLKLSPDGQSLVYATYLGGAGDDLGNAVAVDAAGNAYVGGLTSSAGFPVTPGAFQQTKEGVIDGFVAKLNPAGTGLVYSTHVGGPGGEQVNSIAVDAAGAAYVAGRTDSAGFANAPGVARAGSAAYRSTDGGASWGVSSAGLEASSVTDFAVAPSAPNVVYAATNLAVYRSTDGGASWQRAGQANASSPNFTRSVVVDPANSAVVYAGTSGGGGIYKSTDGGLTFEVKADGLVVPSVNSLAINPTTPTTLFAGTVFGIYRTLDGGQTWTEMRGGISPSVTPNVNEMVVVPSNPQVVFAATSNRGLLKSTDGGTNWAPANNGITTFGSQLSTRALVFDPSNTSTLYVAVNGFAGVVFKSVDGGANWTNSSTGLSVTLDGQTFTPGVTALLVDPASPSTVYAGTSGGGVFKSTDGGANWSPSSTGLANKTVQALALRPGGPAAVLAGTIAGADGFVVKLNPAGSLAEYVRMIGGSENDDVRGVALGAGGSAYVVGTTSSADFPTANAFQPASGGSADAHVTKLDANGATLYSTYLGGVFNEQGAAVAVGPDGAAYVTGGTSSPDFPVANALQPSMAQFDNSDAFVTKLAPNGQALVYSTYLGGAGNMDQGLGVGVGADGSAYVAGGTSSANFPQVEPARGYGGLSDAFVARLNPAGSALLFSTYLGGAAHDQGNALAVNSAGEIFVVGNTASTDFPVLSAVRGTYGGGRSDAFVAKLGPGIDLVVTMTDSPDPVALGADLTYAVKVRNKGDLAATGVTLTDALPAGATLVSAATDRGSCSGAATVVCNLGTLPGGGEANVTLKVKPPAARTINNTATATLNETDAVTADNTASAETTVDFADLAVTKSVINGNVAPGAKAIFVITLTNKSGVDAPSTTLSDVLPAGLTFVSCDAPGPGGGTCGGTGNSRTVTFNPLHAGQTASATIVATLDPGAAAGTVFNNTASVSSTFPDPDASNNMASASVMARVFVAGARSNGKVVLAAGDGIYTVNPDGTERTKILSTPQNTAADHDPVWSPDGTKLAFRRQVFGGAYDFYVMDADGSNLRRLASSGVVSRPTWSPDGSHIAYVKFVVPDYELYATRLDGTGEARIARGLDIVHDIDWSPDGTRFVFQKNNLHVFVMDADGSNQRQLSTFTPSTFGTSDGEPLWSFDGARVTFTRREDNSSDIYVVNADGTGQARVLNQRGVVHGQLSPDGTKLVYQGGDGAGGVSVANLDGSGLPFSLGEGRDPSWRSLPNANPTPTPVPVETFSISGRVNGPDSFFSSVLRLSGTRTATVSADSAGNYSFINLPKGGTYTIMPTNDPVYFNKYTPGSRTVTDLQSNVTGVDFVGERVLHTISGRVTTEFGAPLSGIRVVMTRGGQSETTTDAEGRYSFPIGIGGEFFTVQPFNQFLTFDPVRAVLPPVTGDVTVNFVSAQSSAVSALQGRIIDTSGNSVAGLPVTLTGARRVTVRTDAGGVYTFNNLPKGQTYTVTPSTADGLGFTPAQRTYENLNVAPFDGFTATSALPTAQFEATSVSVAENARVVELTLTRGPDPQLAASVDFETSDLTGSGRSDYIAAYGTVRFKPGETTQKLRVLITDDNLAEGERAFKVTLKGGRNLFLGAASEAVVRITDDDATASAANPLDSSEFFVAQHYADFLNRAPDASGLAFWTNEIESCGADAQCREVKRVNVSGAFFLSIEFQETGFLAYKTHKAAFGTGEALTHKTFLRDTQAIGQGVVVGQGEWHALLDANKEAYLNDFVLRPEFQLAYPQTMAVTQFVDTLHANAGITLTQEERSALLVALTTGATTRVAVLRQVVENAEFSRREVNKAFVLTQYYGYLRRGPSEP